MDYIEIRKKLSSDMSLEYHEQDWGIINSDSARILEFIHFYYKMDPPRFLKYDFVELIAASYNDYLLEGKYNNDIEVSFSEFVIKISEQLRLDEFNPFHYWIRISDNEEFPAGKKILRILNRS